MINEWITVVSEKYISENTLTAEAAISCELNFGSILAFRKKIKQFLSSSSFHLKKNPSTQMVLTHPCKKHFGREGTDDSLTADWSFLSSREKHSGWCCKPIFLYCYVVSGAMC